MDADTGHACGGYDCGMYVQMLTSPSPFAPIIVVVIVMAVVIVIVYRVAGRPDAEPDRGARA